jgi:LytS/YehU family sensor histidine kinase
MLRMQLQPHFLFNTLHTISALMHRDVKRADSMIAALSDLLRMSLRTTGTQEVPLREEVEFLERYIEIMSLRFGDRLVVTVDVDPAILDARVPTLLLQPLVENAIQHGLEPQVEGGRLTVTARRDDGQLVLEVTDTGAGLGGSTHGSGFGLTQVRERLATLHGSGAGFMLEPAPPRGTRATIRLPVG